MSSFYEVPNLLEQFSGSLVKDYVDVIEFAESPKYLGRKLYPRQKTLLKIIHLMELDEYDRSVIKEWEESDEIEVCPQLEDRFKYLKDNGYSHFRTIQLVGGRRSSKGFLTGICIAYKLYLMAQVEDMAAEFNLPEGKEIYFNIVADSLDQAIAHQFSDAADAVLDTKPLHQRKLVSKVLAQSISVNTPGDLRRSAMFRASGVRVDKDMASLVVKANGTNSKTIRGSASIMFIFDEMAHLVAGDSRMSDMELWKAAIPSVNQFREHGMIFANSSPYTKTGKFFELYGNAFEIENEKPVYPDHFLLQFPSWELYKDWQEFGNEMPVVMHPDDDPITAREEKSDPDSFRVEFRAQFAEVVDSFLRPELVDQMFDPVFNTIALGYAPRPTAGAAAYTTYKGHGDPASVGANFGIALGHIEEVINPDTGIFEQHVVFDLIDAFYPDDFENNTIDWLEVVPEVTRIINSYRPFEFTFDQFDCLDKDTMVPTTSGLLTIEELLDKQPLSVGRMRHLDQSIQSMADVRPITSIYHRGITDALTLKTKIGTTITATPEHRLWVRPQKEKPWHISSKPGWMTTNEISIGDSLYLKIGNVFPKEHVELSALIPSKYHPQHGPRYSPNICNEKLACFLGLLVGEGTVSKNVSFTNSNREVVNEFNTLGNQLFGGGWRERQQIQNHSRWSDSWVITGGPTLSRYISNLGVKGLSSRREVPSVIRRSPESVVSAFLRGLFEGEGGVNIARVNDEMIRLDTTSRELAEQTQQLLLNLGILSTLWGPHYDKRGFQPKFRIKIFGKDILTFADKIGFISSKKIALLDKAVRQISDRGNKVGLRQRIDRDQNGIWVRVTDIKETTSDTYDLSVPGPECFVANGIISHNSRMAIQSLQKNMSQMGIGETTVYQKVATEAQNIRRAKNFRAALNLGRVHAPHPDAFNPLATRNSIALGRDELKFLQERNGKVDKQKIGPIRTKDIADCIMEVTDALIGDSISTNIAGVDTMPALGAQGGFGLGNTDKFTEMAGWYGDTAKGTRPYMPERQTIRGKKPY